MSSEEIPQSVTIEGILFGGQKPLESAYRDGWNAREAGKGFHEGPRPSGSVEAMSWRFGWNDCALLKDQK